MSAQTPGAIFAGSFDQRQTTMADQIKTIGVVLSERVLSGLVLNDVLQGAVRVFPPADDEHGLIEFHTDAVIAAICEQVLAIASGHDDITAVGVAMPGLIKHGTVEDSPNLPQLKGAHIKDLLERELAGHGLHAPVCVLNDADGAAAGFAAHSGKLDQLIRVWTLGIGIGYGRHPFTPGVWEGGHTVVTMDDKERFCGCGGRGHLEGIMGHRAMRLRFLDMEPEEVFSLARSGRSPEAERCQQFRLLWHRALAAGISSSIHLEGPGKFFLTGFNQRFVDLPLLREYIGDMVKMSPLQSYTIEIVEDDPAVRVLGAAVAAGHATSHGC